MRCPIYENVYENKTIKYNVINKPLRIKMFDVWALVFIYFHVLLVQGLENHFTFRAIHYHAHQCLLSPVHEKKQKWINKRKNPKDRQRSRIERKISFVVRTLCCHLLDSAASILNCNIFMCCPSTRSLSYYNKRLQNN